MTGAGFLVLSVVTALVAVGFKRHPEPAERARFLRRLGFDVMAVCSTFAGLFIVGETLSDPGGWEGVGLLALWVVPLVAVAAVGWFLPAVAAKLFPALVAVVVGLSVWFAIDPDAWRSFEDGNGPVRAIATFALASALGLYGLRRTGAAGVMLLVVGLVPVALGSFGGGGMSSLAAASTAPVLTGVLYVWSTRSNPPPAPRSAPLVEKEQRTAA